MRVWSALSVVGMAATADFIALDRSCTDPSTGCNGGCYQWSDDKDFFANCLQGKTPVAGKIMPNPVVVSLDCAKLGFVPLTQVPDGSPFPGGSSAPDSCFGGAGSRVNFFATDQKWFWDIFTASGFNPETICPQWQTENPQCFDPSVALA